MVRVGACTAHPRRYIEQPVNYRCRHLGVKGFILSVPLDRSVAKITNELGAAGDALLSFVLTENSSHLIST